MPSFDQVNYALRPSKTIERLLAFEGVRQVMQGVELNDMVYVGFGSIWFVDYHLAHRTLGIRDLISIEADEIGYRRAKFNSPFNSCKVFKGFSGDVVPRLLGRAEYSRRPWCLWLDFDYEVRQDMLDEVRECIENLPHNSIFMITFSAKPRRYGAPEDRDRNLSRLFGSSLDPDLDEDDLDEGLADVLADSTIAFMQNVADASGRPGGFVEAFRLIYHDTSTMVTVGGVLPSRGSRTTISSIVDQPSWPGWEAEVIQAPHLTWLESQNLQQLLPKEGRITKSDVRGLGFDLSVDQLKSFSRFYKYYPSFAQITQ
jgi:hypothetical protein